MSTLVVTNISDGTNSRTVSGIISGPPRAVVRDEKSTTTYGGTFTSGAWRTRDLNTEHFDPEGIVSLSSNQFTLQAGTYFISWSAPGHSVSRHVSKLRNVTDGTDVEIGTAQYVGGVAVTTQSSGNARVTIASAKAFEIQHRCESTSVTNGFGVNQESNGTISVYTVVEIIKEA